MKSGSNLERVIASGKPAVTAELGPPMSADGKEVVEKAHKLKGFCDAANITDCQTAVVRISSIAAAFIAHGRMQKHGEPGSEIIHVVVSRLENMAVAVRPRSRDFH